MDTTLEKVDTDPNGAIVSRYDVMLNGEHVGAVWKVAGRSFSGAWHWSRSDGSNGARCVTRRDAVNRVMGS